MICRRFGSDVTSLPGTAVDIGVRGPKGPSTNK